MKIKLSELRKIIKKKEHSLKTERYIRKLVREELSRVKDTLTITATVDIGTGGTMITNTASVTAADQADPAGANDSDNAPITVAVPAAGVETQITTASSDQRPAWAPDGVEIVFDSNRSGNRDLWSVPVGGGSATQITTNIELDQHADWSPDASKIVFSAVMGGGLPDLYTIPRTGGTPVLLLADAGTNDRFPAWSPDSTQIAYARDNDIYVVPAAGGAPVQLTTNPSTDLHPSWSPDGTQIVFLSNRSGNNDLWTMPSTGEPAAQLTTHSGNDGAPDWSPDGTRVAFQSNRSGNNDVWMISSGGGTAIQVTSTSSNDVQPDWSPSGGQITFARDGAIWVSALLGADLGVDKTVSDAAPNEGDSIDYVITLTNDGPGAATTVTVSDVLPAGVTFQSSVATAGSYDDGAGEWSVASIGASTSETLTISVSVDPRNRRHGDHQHGERDRPRPDGSRRRQQLRLRRHHRPERGSGRVEGRRRRGAQRRRHHHVHGGRREPRTG